MVMGYIRGKVMYLLKLECIGDNIKQMSKFYSAKLDSITPGLGKAVIGDMPARYFVAEITGLNDKYKFARKFLKSKKDYLKANSIGSRGIYAFYLLENNKIYDIKEPVSWGRAERYYCKIENNKLVKMGEEEVIKWLKNT